MTSTTEYGIFNDEGLLEDGFFSEAEAQMIASSEYSEDNVTVLALCPDHEGRPSLGCEQCDEDAP